MPRFQIVVPHQSAQCLEAMEQLITHDPAVLNGALAGCPFGDHTIYTVVDASTAEEARTLLPPAFRSWTRVAQVEPVDVDAIVEKCRAYHENLA